MSSHNLCARVSARRALILLDLGSYHNLVRHELASMRKAKVCEEKILLVVTQGVDIGSTPAMIERFPELLTLSLAHFIHEDLHLLCVSAGYLSSSYRSFGLLFHPGAQLMSSYS